MKEGGTKTEKITGERGKENTKQSEERYSTFDKLSFFGVQHFYCKFYTVSTSVSISVKYSEQ